MNEFFFSRISIIRPFSSNYRIHTTRKKRKKKKILSNSSLPESLLSIIQLYPINKLSSRWTWTRVNASFIRADIFPGPHQLFIYDLVQLLNFRVAFIEKPSSRETLLKKIRRRRRRRRKLLKISWREEKKKKREIVQIAESVFDRWTSETKVIDKIPPNAFRIQTESFISADSWLPRLILELPRRWLRTAK